MRVLRSLAAAAALVILNAPGAAAQHSGQAGVTMGYPASFGIIWHLNDKVAIRPELTLSGSSADTSSSSLSIDSSGWNIGTGVSALFYMRSYDRLRTYFSPRFIYSHASSDSSTSSFTTSSSTITSTAVGGSGSFGAQYGLGDKFSVFGEVGFGISHAKTSSDFSPTRVSGYTWGTRSGVGVIFYF